MDGTDQLVFVVSVVHTYRVGFFGTCIIMFGIFQCLNVQCFLHVQWRELDSLIFRLWNVLKMSSGAEGTHRCEFANNHSKNYN